MVETGEAGSLDAHDAEEVEDDATKVMTPGEGALVALLLLVLAGIAGMFIGQASTEGEFVAPAYGLVGAGLSAVSAICGVLHPASANPRGLLLYVSLGAAAVGAPLMFLAAIAGISLH